MTSQGGERDERDTGSKFKAPVTPPRRAASLIVLDACGSGYTAEELAQALRLNGHGDQ